MRRRARAYSRVKKGKSARGFVTDEKTSRRMASIRQHGTAPELAVRKALRTLGISYRTANRDLPGSPDLANRRRKWAIFVHGCYWHRHRGCSRTTTPRRNRQTWVSKFEANVERDKRKARELRSLGFRVLIVWECALDDSARLLRRLASICP